MAVLRTAAVCGMPAPRSMIWSTLYGSMPAIALRNAAAYVLTACQDATRAATGHDGRLYRDPWVPHITLAYSNSTRPAAPAIEALGRELPRQQITVKSVSLISQAPSQQWTWHLLTDVPIGEPPV
jgi:2'-5' RNA ligase